MSSTTIVDPSGSSPIPAYNNDRNLTKDVLLFVENSNITESKGLFKVNTLFGTQHIVNKINTQTLSGGSTDTTRVYENFGRFMAPVACSLMEMSVSLSEATSLSSSSKFTITVEKATYTTDPTVPVAQFSTVGSMTVTVDGNTQSKLFQAVSSSGIAIAANDTVRFKLVETGTPDAVIQLQAIFKVDHV